MRVASCLALLLALAACEEKVAIERKLSTFEVTLTSPVGTPIKRCPLPGTPTVAFDLTGCPTYARDASAKTIARVSYEAAAIDNHGALLESFNGLARVKVVPGRVEAGGQNVRFTGGRARGEVSFRAAFGDTMLWISDEVSPAREPVNGLGVECGYDADPTCGPFGLTCVNTTPAVHYDPSGLAYCTLGCGEDGACPTGYSCAQDFVAYADAAADLSHGACVRTQPSYSVGVAGPIHLVEPTLADVSRTDSLVSSPFVDEFIQVARGKMIVTAVRIDGFYVTDTCPLPIAEGGPGPDDPACTDDDRRVPPEFNHLFVFNFSRPEDLFPGDQLISVAGPMTEFVGLTEMGFPLWEVNYAVGPQPVPPPVDLHDSILGHFPELVEPGAACYDSRHDKDKQSLLDCAYAMERLEAARVQFKVGTVVRITPGSSEDQTLEEFGQWPVLVDSPITKELRFNVITRENIPFFDPRPLGGRRVNQTVVGNLRQVAFDDRQDPIWIIEPRDQADCPWCVN